MASLLYRLGRFSFRHRFPVLAVWVVIIAAVVVSAVSFAGPRSTSFTVPGTESQRALDALEREFPAAAAASGVVALRTPDSRTFADPDVQDDVATLAAEVAKLPGVVSVQSPYDAALVSADGRTAILGVQYDEPNHDVDQDQRDAFLKLADATTAMHLIVAPGGAVASGPAAVSGREGIGVLIALFVLILTLGSLVAAGMTLLNAFIGVALGLLGLTALSGVVDLNSTAPILALMLGLAVGIDYALFITARYRTLRTSGLEPDEAAGRAVATAGSAVVFAGLTVVITLAALAVVGIPFIGIMGLAASGTVAIAVLVSLSLLPALLSFGGRLVLPRSVRRASPGDGTARNRRPELGLRWVAWVLPNRGRVLGTGLITLLVLASPLLGLRLALSDDGSAPEGTPQRLAYDLISDGFGAGYNARLILVGSTDSPTRTAELVSEAATRIAALDGVVQVVPAGANAGDTTSTLLVLPQDGPSSASTQELVHDIRDTVADLPAGDESLDLTGLTAVGVDVSERLAGAFPVYLLIVVGLSLLLLTVAFRSLLVPIKATVGFLLSLGATFGVTVAVFQWGWLANLVGASGTGAVDSLLPILLVGILFGLAMDYEIFLVSRMREEHAAGADSQAATIRGVQHGARVVTAAALIMTSVFAGFVLIEDPTLKVIGFALALGVFVDAFLVRMTLVPAVMSILGDRAWWLPRWLDRLVPDVDVEGHAVATGVHH